MATDDRKVVALVFHVSIFCIYLYSLLFYYIVRTAGAPHRNTYGGILKLFTFWNQSMQAAYFGYSVINDVFGSNMIPSEYHKASSSVSVLQRIRDLIAASSAFPGSLFVTVSFWILYSIDRELIFPAVLDEFYPFWLNYQLGVLACILR